MRQRFNEIRQDIHAVGAREHRLEGHAGAHPLAIRRQYLFRIAKAATLLCRACPSASSAGRRCTPTNDLFRLHSDDARMDSVSRPCGAPDHLTEKRA
jgi:hypothetical protein